MNIKVKEYIDNGFSIDDAMKLRPLIQDAISKNAPLQLDFANVRFFTTLFFSQALTFLIDTIGGDKFKELIDVQNLSDSGRATYEHALTYAVEYYSKTDEERKEYNSNVDRVIEDLQGE